MVENRATLTRLKYCTSDKTNRITDLDSASKIWFIAQTSFHFMSTMKLFRQSYLLNLWVYFLYNHLEWLYIYWNFNSLLCTSNGHRTLLVIYFRTIHICTMNSFNLTHIVWLYTARVFHFCIKLSYTTYHKDQISFNHIDLDRYTYIHFLKFPNMYIYYMHY